MIDQMSAIEGRLATLSAHARPIFRRWEKLRIPYNVVLAVTLFLIHGLSLGLEFFEPLALGIWLAGGVLANLCFLAGPLAECYCAWLGLRSRVVTAALFLGGVLVSIPCVALFPMGLAFSMFSG